MPIGLEEGHVGVVDLVEDKAFIFTGEKGEVVEEGPIPDDLAELGGYRAQAYPFSH